MGILDILIQYLNESLCSLTKNTNWWLLFNASPSLDLKILRIFFCILIPEPSSDEDGASQLRGTQDQMKKTGILQGTMNMKWTWPI